MSQLTECLVVATASQAPSGVQINHGVGMLVAAVFLFVMSLGGEKADLRWSRMRGGQPLEGRTKRVAQIILRLAAAFCVISAIATIVRSR